MRLQEIAARLGLRLEPPDADAEITGIAAIDSAAPDQITFFDAMQSSEAQAELILEQASAEPPAIDPESRRRVQEDWDRGERGEDVVDIIARLQGGGEA